MSVLQEVLCAELVGDCLGRPGDNTAHRQCFRSVPVAICDACRVFGAPLNISVLQKVLSAELMGGNLAIILHAGSRGGRDSGSAAVPAPSTADSSLQRVASVVASIAPPMFSEAARA